MAIIEQEQERRRNKEQAERKKEEEMRRKEITYEVLDDEHVAIQIGGETHVMHFQGAYNFVRFGHCAKLRDFLKANFPMGGQYQ